MAKQTFSSDGGRYKVTDTTGKTSSVSADEAVRELKTSTAKKAGPDYRSRSLALHGLICARCGREFEGKNLKLLTVHHKDSDPLNNPPDGSNWENLCVYCHDDEHSREKLGDEVGAVSLTESTEVVHYDNQGGLGSFGDLLAAKLKKK